LRPPAFLPVSGIAASKTNQATTPTVERAKKVALYPVLTTRNPAAALLSEPAIPCTVRLDGMLNAIKHRVAFDPPKKKVVPVIETAQGREAKGFLAEAAGAARAVARFEMNECRMVPARKVRCTADRRELAP
jgi:hypothetical protein